MEITQTKKGNKSFFKTNKAREAIWGYLFIAPNFIVVLNLYDYSCVLFIV